MGFGASNDLREASEQEPLGVDPKRTNTNEQGRPLPYFAGIAKLGVTWISEPWDVRSKPIKKKVGKKKETVGFNYYAPAVSWWRIGNREWRIGAAACDGCKEPTADCVF